MSTSVQEQFITPPLALQEVVEHFVLLSVPAGAQPAVRTLLPSFQVVLLINLGAGRVELWPASDSELVTGQPLVSVSMLGPVKTAWRYRLAGGARVLAVNFTMAGFFRLFQVPLEQLGSGLTDPDAVMEGRGFADLWTRLRSLPTTTQVVHMLTGFCLPQLQGLDPSQTELLAHLPLLAASSHLNPLKVLAAASRCSERAVQLRFQKYLGFSAKEAIRFLRFRRVLDELPQPGYQATPPEWGAVLDQYGYYDQSHLIHDFGYFLRQPPTKVAGLLLRGDAICFTRTELLADKANG